MKDLGMENGGGTRRKRLPCLVLLLLVSCYKVLWLSWKHSFIHSFYSFGFLPSHVTMRMDESICRRRRRPKKLEQLR